MDTLSALVDGELKSDEAAREYGRLRNTPESRDTWDTYLLIGDVMRGTPVLSSGFERRFSERLAAEPTVLAPAAVRPVRRMAPAISYALSAAASVSAVAVVAWLALSGGTPESAPGLVAQSAAPAAVAATATALPQSSPDGGRAYDYLLAHQGVSPTTALQGVAPYVRTVSLARDGEKR